MTVSEVTTLWFWIGFGGLSLGSLAILTLGSAFRKKDQFHAMIAVAVTAIATISYYALARGQADITVGGDVIYYGRYVDWLFTTPLLLLSLLVIALPPLKALGGSRQRLSLIGSVILADVLMIVTGLFADLSTNNFDTAVWYAASCFWFLVVGWLMFGEVKRQAYANSQRIGNAYVKLLSFLAIAWILYPIVWVLGGTGTETLSPSTEAAAYAIMDISAKAVFGILTLVVLKKLENKEDDRSIVDAA